MATGPARLTMNQQIIRELTYASKDPEKLITIASAAKAVGPQPGIPSLAKRVAEEVGLPEDDVTRAIRTLLNIYYAQRSLRLGAEGALAVITERMEEVATTEKTKEDLVAWKKATPKILDIVKSVGPGHPLLMSEKAGRVVFAHQCVLTDAKLYTDVRPVFTERADSIVQAVVTHVLSVEYQDGGDERRLLITLDASDVVALKRECNRAEQKAAVVKMALKDMPWPTFIFHEPDPPSAASTDSGESDEGR